MKPFDITGPLPSGTLVLEASAGTGKTTAIAGLVSRYVVEMGIDLGQIMIATFSGASTRELRARVRDQLETVADALAGGRTTDGVATHLAHCSAEEQTRRLNRARAALEGFDSATICTTHQFCDRMLSELGVLVDHEPDTTLVDDLSGVLEQVVADEYLARYSASETVPFDVETATLVGRAAGLYSPALPLAPLDASDDAAERVSFASAVRREVEARKRRLGLYTFDDMQLRLRDALRSSQAELARAILQDRFPIVLIDEFQDTDPVQWDIVRRAFIGDCVVVLIGDPKQSIYGFRGADVYAYLSAVVDADMQVLDTNHRSDPRVVEAVSTLFAGAELGDSRIQVTPVRTSPQTPRLRADGPWAAPFRLRYLSAEGPATLAASAIDDDLVADVARLLRSGSSLHRPRQGTTHPLRASDVAVIVCTNRRGQAIRQRLADAGIPAVFNGSSSVLESEAAQDWRTLLVAFSRPRTREVRAVALTDFIGWSLSELATADDLALGELAQRVRAWHRLANERGVAALFEVMTSVDGISRALLRRRGGDRAITDLRHVADLLQAQQSRSGLGMAQLLDWLDDQIDRGQASRDERSRRLETDADAVQIMTVHQAKGLQFPVVYVPEMTTHRTWTPRIPEPFHVHLTHDGTRERFLDVGGDDAPGGPERRLAHQAEEAGERLRWLYVALTRAECHLTVWWAPTPQAEGSPLHRVLFRDTSTTEVPLVIPCDTHRPEQLGRLVGSGISLELMGQLPPDPVALPQPLLIGARPFTRAVDLTWRRTSYSALTARSHHARPELLADASLLTDEPVDPADAVPAESDEVPAVVGSVALDPLLAQPSPMAELPGGVAFGSLVHAVLEAFDPQDLGSLTEIVTRETSRLPVADVTTEALVTALGPCLRTPLGPLFDGRRLCDISPTDRLPELDFELPLGGAWSGSGPAGYGATMADLTDLVEAHLDPSDLLADYPTRLRAAGLGIEPLRGFLTGSIDATIRVGERVVVVDYKTNRLAPPGVDLMLQHYTPAAMAEAMMDSHYPLQALLYSVALHRFLRWRWASYDPTVQLGGIAYLFVRGMAGPDTPVVDGMPTGVFTWRPPAALVTELSDLLGGAPAPARRTKGVHDAQA